MGVMIAHWGLGHKAALISVHLTIPTGAVNTGPVSEIVGSYHHGSQCRLGRHDHSYEFSARTPAARGQRLAGFLDACVLGRARNARNDWEAEDHPGHRDKHRTRPLEIQTTEKVS